MTLKQKVFLILFRNSNQFVLKNIVIYSKSEIGKAFVHANCMFVHEAELSERNNLSERKRHYSRMLYLVLYDISVESDSVTLYSKF
jgi:hypothetical protein